jgi:hypothetical protein
LKQCSFSTRLFSFASDCSSAYHSHVACSQGPGRISLFGANSIWYVVVLAVMTPPDVNNLMHCTCITRVSRVLPFYTELRRPGEISWRTGWSRMHACDHIICLLLPSTLQNDYCIAIHLMHMWTCKNARTDTVSWRYSNYAIATELSPDSH